MKIQSVCFLTTLFSSATIVTTDLSYSTLQWPGDVCVMSDTLVYPFIRLVPVFSLTSSPLTNTYDIYLHVLASPEGFAPFSNLEPILLATTVGLVQFRVDP